MSMSGRCRRCLRLLRRRRDCHCTICEMTGREEDSWMNAREFFEGGHVIQANPLLHTLRNGRRFVLFSFVFLLAVQALLFALDIMYHHGVFVAKDAIPPFGYGIVLFALIPIIYMYQERYWKRIEHRRNASANGDYTLLAAEQPWPEEVPT